MTDSKTDGTLERTRLQQHHSVTFFLFFCKAIVAVALLLLLLLLSMMPFPHITFGRVKNTEIDVLFHTHTSHTNYVYICINIIICSFRFVCLFDGVGVLSLRLFRVSFNNILRFLPCHVQLFVFVWQVGLARCAHTLIDTKMIPFISFINSRTLSIDSI